MGGRRTRAASCADPTPHAHRARPGRGHAAGLRSPLHGPPARGRPLGITSPIGVAQAAREIRRLIVEQRIDLVHSFSATASVAINLALRVRGADGLDGVRLVSSPMGLQNSPRELPVTTWLRNWFLA